ncbi:MULTISPECIES: M3 family metallopeptidase [unclassified Moraxella]|uniref:M3 family metallopeptidase n=1 Tax=unclassified Moraxella TaxID=2685852 RepID=UPI003AF6AB03
MPTHNLHLVNFHQVDLTTLKTQILDALDDGKAFLAMLDDEPTASDSQHAFNDIIAFEHVNMSLDRSWGLLSHLNSVMSSDDIRALHHELLPQVSDYSTSVGQHLALFSRYQQIIADTPFFDNLEPARQRALTLAKQGFELSGVALPSEQQQQFAKLATELSSLSAKFSDNVLDATQSYFLPLTQDQLAGLPDTALAMLADAGQRYREQTGDTTPTEYVATLNIPVYLAVMTYADDRALREQLYHAYVTRASENFVKPEFNNADIMVEILAKRQQKAQLLGFTNYAELSLATKMADDVATVAQFLRDLAVRAKPFALQDLKQLQTEGLAFDIEEVKAWDTAYLAEKVKQRKFNLSQEAVRPYFPLPTVIAGLFEIVKRLFAVTIVEQTDSVQRWHDDVRFYHILDDKGELVGGFYFDLYARQGKRGGAWMSGFQARYQHTPSGHQQLPVCFMVANFSPSIDGKPSLLTHDEVTTLFHEFGHGLHHLLTEVSVSDVAGVNGVEWDAVELPSQFLENWAWHAEGIALISGHVETGDTLPMAMLNSLLSAKNFQSGMQTLRQLEFALFDLLLHAKRSETSYEDLLELLNQVRQDVAIIPVAEYNRFANGFSHIFAGGYSAGYYSYKWAELLSADAFDKFEQEGIFNADTGKAFREQILARGGSRDAKVNFEAFRGREASIEALLRHSGFYDELLSDDSDNQHTQSW